MNLSIANVFNVSVSQPGAQIGEYNTSNLAIISHEIAAESFGDDQYKLYLDPTEVGKDFGTNSITYKMAVAVFSQTPNILGPGGYLVIFSLPTARQDLSFPATPTTGGFKLNYEGGATSTINFNDSASAIQAKLRSVAGLEGAVVTGNIPAGLVVSLNKFGPAALLTISDNTLQTAGAVAVVPSVTSDIVGETYEEAILRTSDIVEYFGVMATALLDSDEIQDSAALVQAMNKLSFVLGRAEADVEAGGKLDLLRSGSLKQTRGLYYGGSLVDGLRFVAAYAGRALSVDFNGSNTTITMHLKDLAGIQPDPTMTQTLLQKCEVAGADTYVSIQGVSKTLTSGANTFFDRIYNQLWIVGAFKVAGFNLYASTPTKIPQTEDGQLLLESTLRKVADQAVDNQYLAPGNWDSPVSFGSQADLKANILQKGYYFYSSPVSKQSTAARMARQAPLVQAALKEAGANHEASLIININA